MSVAAGPVAVPDSTGPTFALLRELRRGRARKQAASIAFWVYLALFIVAVWGGSLIVAAYRALRHPPPPTGLSLRVLHALPAGLAALALLVLLLLVRDALWRGPVTVPGATVDWLLGTPVDRRRLLRPRFRLSASGAIAAGAAVGIVPAAALVALGLGGRDGGDVLRLTGAGMLSAALLFAAGTGLAGLIERQPASWFWVRRTTPVVLAAAAVLAGIAAWAAFGRLPAVVNTVLLWSGPWGWAAQGLTALAGRGALSGLTLSSAGYGPVFVVPGSVPASPASLWPVATALLAAVALAALAAGQRAAAGVPAAALRARARTLGAMSTAALSMNTRGVAAAYGAAASRQGLAGYHHYALGGHRPVEGLGGQALGGPAPRPGPQQHRAHHGGQHAERRPRRHAGQHGRGRQGHRGGPPYPGPAGRIPLDQPGQPGARREQQHGRQHPGPGQPEHVPAVPAAQP